MRATVLAAALVLAGAPLAWGLDPAPEPYREAALAGNVGVVAGRAYEERRRPADAERALVGTVVTLVPRSPKLLDEVGRIRPPAPPAAVAAHPRLAIGLGRRVEAPRERRAGQHQRRREDRRPHRPASPGGRVRQRSWIQSHCSGTRRTAASIAALHRIVSSMISRSTSPVAGRSSGGWITTG